VLTIKGLWFFFREENEGCKRSKDKKQRWTPQMRRRRILRKEKELNYVTSTILRPLHNPICLKKSKIFSGKWGYAMVSPRL
jgi:hypothetical protein